ncbi:hypothetical protein [Brevibacterium oceani]|uniref:hypothetical protein n=1 Tax=Brevibacterium oceani TaxID=358099 RepID=UPI001B32217D|nr:hypothetical protein [Brevibacterium oceani]
MIELVGTALGSTVIAVVITEMLHRFRPGRIGEKVGALKDELAVLRGMDDGTVLGKAAYAVGSATVENAMINRLAPNRAIQSIGLVFFSMVSFILVLTFSSIADPNGIADHTFIALAVILYTAFGIFLLFTGLFGWLASSFVRSSVSLGFRLSPEFRRDQLNEAFADLKSSVFKPIDDGDRQHYVFRRWYQICLTQTGKTHIRAFMREIDNHSDATMSS